MHKSLTIQVTENSKQSTLTHTITFLHTHFVANKSLDKRECDELNEDTNEKIFSLEIERKRAVQTYGSQSSHVN